MVKYITASCHVSLALQHVCCQSLPSLTLNFFIQTRTIQTLCSNPKCDFPVLAAGFFVVYQFFHLPSTASLAELEEAGQQFCTTPWSSVNAERGAEIHVDRYCFRCAPHTHTHTQRFNNQGLLGFCVQRSRHRCSVLCAFHSHWAKS